MKENNSTIYEIKYLLFCLVFISVILIITVASSLLLTTSKQPRQESVDSADEQLTIIIDAGHGGEDGGAVGINGCFEKDLNLIISERLSDIFRASGVNVIMTRTEDVLLYDRNADYKGKKKMLDLAARLKIANENENCVFVSIHMNSFPEERYSGLQVYYSRNNEISKDIADSIQGSVKNLLQINNQRTTKAATSSIYLLDRAINPSVLIECGFLSNKEECEQLCDDVYQKQLALAIFNGIYDHIIKDST